MQLHKNIIDGLKIVSPAATATATKAAAVKGKQKKNTKKNVKQAPLSKFPIPFGKADSVTVKDVTFETSTFPVQKSAYEIKFKGRPLSQSQRGKNPLTNRYFDGSAGPKQRAIRRLKGAIELMEKKPSATTNPMQVEVFFHFRIPQSNPGNKIKVHDFYDKVPDIDNLQKFVFDALKGLFYADDKQIVYIEACKKYDSYDHTDILIGEWCPKK